MRLGVSMQPSQIPPRTTDTWIMKDGISEVSKRPESMSTDIVKC